MVSGRRIRAAIVKEFRQFLRDPVLLFLVLWLYTIEVVICAVALSFDLRNEPVAVFDLDRTPASRQLAAAFDNTSSFRVAAHPSSNDETARLLDRGEARVVVRIPDGYQESVRGGRPDDVQLVIDGTNSMIGMMALGEAQRIVAASAMRSYRGVLDRRSRDAIPAAVPVVENRVRIQYNPGLRYDHFIVLSMLAIAAYMVGVIHAAASIVKEKETGTIEQILVTPINRIELIVAKTLPTFVIGLLAFGPGLLVARAFEVPFRGSPFDFAIVSIVFLVSAVGTGVLIASLTRTLQQALLVSFFVLFPVLFLSGTMTPIETMPPLIELATRLSPLRYYMDSLLAIFMKGVRLDVLWPQLAWMGGIGAALLAIGAGTFRRSTA